MASAYKCDLCGKLFEGRPPDVHGMQLTIGGDEFFVNITIYRKNRKGDFCRTCALALASSMAAHLKGLGETAERNGDGGPGGGAVPGDAGETSA